MLRQAAPLGTAPSRFAARTSLRYSSSSPVHRAAAVASPALSQNASDLSEAAHSHRRVLYSHWNAVGDEPVTAETISALLSNSLSNLGVKDFLSRQECARMVNVIRTHPIVTPLLPRLIQCELPTYDKIRAPMAQTSTHPSAK